METLIIKTPDKATADNIRKYAEQFADVVVNEALAESETEVDEATQAILNLVGLWGDRDVTLEQIRERAWKSGTTAVDVS
jgi:hypothetical protein